MELAEIGSVLLVLISYSALIQTSAGSSIRINQQNDHKTITSTTHELLSSLNHCIVFIFDWALDDDYKSWTPTNSFLFFSESMNCAVVVDSYTQFGNRSYMNPRFEFPSDIWEPHPLFTKYTTTLTNIYCAEATSIAIQYRAVATLSTVLQRYNIPFNTVLMFVDSRLVPSLDVNLFSEFPLVSTPAAYIMILDETEVYVVGFAQALRSAWYLFRVDVLEVAQIQRMHRILHKDLQGANLQVTLTKPREFCDSTSMATVGADECIINLVVEHFNLTFCDYVYTPCIGHKVAYIVPSMVPKNLRLFSRKASFKMDLVNYCTRYMEATFICIVTAELMGWKAFVKAFDVSTWVVTLVACMTMTATIAATSTKTQASMWLKLRASATVVLMLLFDRFYSSYTLIRAATRPTRLLISLWAFGALLVGMSYSGNMVSELTSPSLPSLPRGLQELSEVDYRIFTRTLVHMSGKEQMNGTQQMKKYLHYDIDDYFSHHGGKNGTLPLMLLRFRKAVTFVRYADSTTLARKDKRSQVLFAYADTSWSVKAYQVWSNKDSSRKRALYGGELQFFKKRINVGVVSNFMSPVLNWCFAGLFESGVYNYWQNVINSKYVYYFKSFHKDVETTWLRKTRLAAIWQDFEPLLNSKGSWNAITFVNLIAAFKFLGIGALLSLLVFINEQTPDLYVFTYSPWFLVAVPSFGF